MEKLADPTERAWRSKTWRPLWAQPPAGQRLRENCERATALLYEVAYQQHHLFTASEEINPKILSRCKGLVFTFTYQVGPACPSLSPSSFIGRNITAKGYEDIPNFRKPKADGAVLSIGGSFRAGVNFHSCGFATKGFDGSHHRFVLIIVCPRAGWRRD
jgi:hypothetical protein